MANYYKHISAGDNSPLSGYNRLATTDGFTVYLDSGKCSADYAIPFLEQHYQDFQHSVGKNIYISCEKHINRVSVLLCNKNVKNPTADCSSYYYL